MKRVLPLIFALFCSSSCERVVEENLYNEYDEDWGLVQARIKEQCEGSAIFKELRKRSAFSSYYDENMYFEVTVPSRQDPDDDRDYIRVGNITSTSITISYHDSQAAANSKEYTFSSTQNEDLIDGIVNGICATEEEYEYGHSDLDNSSTFDFTDVRKDGSGSNYTEVTENYFGETTFPLPLILWNRDKTTNTVNGDSNDEDKETWRVNRIALSKCLENTDCKTAEETYEWSYTDGTITVNSGAYGSNATSSVVISN